MFVTRCDAPAVTRIAAGEPRVAGLCDCAGHELDEHLHRLPDAETRKRADALVAARYATVGAA